jgi:hypothetical protein
MVTVEQPETHSNQHKNSKPTQEPTPRLNDRRLKQRRFDLGLSVKKQPCPSHEKWPNEMPTLDNQHQGWTTVKDPLPKSQHVENP